MADEDTQNKNNLQTTDANEARPMISVEEIEKAVAQAREKAKDEIVAQTVEPQSQNAYPQPAQETISEGKNIPETTAVSINIVKENIKAGQSEKPITIKPAIVETTHIPETTPIAISSIKESLSSISRVQSEIKKEKQVVENLHSDSIVRTFKTDIAEAVREQNMSLAGVAIKEDEKRREEAGVAIHTSRVNKLLVIGSIILVLAGILTIGYISFSRREKNIPVTTKETRAIVFADDTKDIDITGLGFKQIREQIISEVRGDRLRIGNIKNLRFIDTRVVTKNNEEVTERYWVPTEEWFTRLSIPARPSFTRQLSPEFLYGIFSFRGQDGFLILKTTDYASMFAQLLGYEDKLARDLYPILTGSEVPDVTDRVWGDEVIDNIDARILRTTSGDLVMLWSFVGTRDTVLIATNPEIFKEVVERIQTPKTENR